MNALCAGAVLLAKDLRIEGRCRRTISVAAALGVLIVAVLAFGLRAQLTANGAGAAAILWVAYLFGGMLCFERSMAVERECDAISGLLLTPIDPGVIFMAKVASNLVLTVGFAFVVTPVAMLFCGFDLSAAPWTFVCTTFLGLVGFAALGTLFSAALSSSRVVAVAVLPLCLPLILTSSQILMRTFGQSGAMPSEGMPILIAFDAIFLAASWLMFEHILEPEEGS